MSLYLKYIFISFDIVDNVSTFYKTYNRIDHETTPIKA